MKFQINNKGNVVDITLTFRCGWAGDYTYHFTHNVEHASYAGLLAETLDEQFANHIKQIRQAAYKEGWEDKQKRRTKRTDFDWCPNTIKMPRYD